MQTRGATGDGNSAVATPDGKKPKEEEKKVAIVSVRNNETCLFRTGFADD